MNNSKGEDRHMEAVNYYERRNLDRFEIPGAYVTYNTSDGQFNTLPMFDISIGSIRFRYIGNLSKGYELTFGLLIPSKEKISLKGTIIQINKDIPEQKDFVVVQFAPFGTDSRYNSLYSHDQLNELFVQYTKISENSHLS